MTLAFRLFCLIKAFSIYHVRAEKREEDTNLESSQSVLPRNSPPSCVCACGSGVRAYFCLCVRTALSVVLVRARCAVRGDECKVECDGGFMQSPNVSEGSSGFLVTLQSQPR